MASEFNIKNGFISNNNSIVQGSLTTTTLQVSGTVTPTSTVARSINISPTLVSTANNDVLVGLDINPTFTLGAFTGTTSAALRVAGNILPDADNTRSIGTGTQGLNLIWVRTIRSNGTLGFYPGGVLAATITTTGNFLLGTTVDGGAKLQVSGTVTPTSTVARGASISPILTSTANGDTLVGLDINPTFTLGAFTGTTSAALRVSGNIIPSVNATYDLGTPSLNFTRVRAQNVVSNGSLSLYTGGNLGLTVATSTNILIGTTTDTASSILKLESTTKGFLPPRMTTSQINGIVSPVQGLTVFNTDLNTLCFYTTSWQKVTNTAM